MRPFLVQLDGTESTAQRALGAVLAAPVRSRSRKQLLSKGHIVAEADLAALGELRGVTLSLIALDAGDEHEDAAALRLGRAAAGEGVRLEGPFASRVRLVAAYNGLLRIDAGVLASMNRPGNVSVYTLLDGQPVQQGTVVAEAKVTPLVVAGAELTEAEQAAIQPPVQVQPFRPLRAAALVRERISPAQAQRVSDSLARKLAWFGSSLDRVVYAPPVDPPEALARRMAQLLEAGAQLLLGGSASDPMDQLLNALTHLDAGLERLGVPAHPGSMLWLAYAAGVPVVGVPSCGSYSEATSLDLLLPLLHTGDRLTSSTLAGLAHGGLLAKSDYRIPKYGPHIEETR